MNARQVARGLGWFSLGLGAVEVLAPGQVSRFVGAPQKEGSGLVRVYGARELLAGAGLLTQPGAATTWMWARVNQNSPGKRWAGSAIRSPGAMWSVPGATSTTR